MRSADAPSINATWRLARSVTFGHQESSIDILADISDLAFGEYMAPGWHLPTLHSAADGGKESFPIDSAPRLFSDEVTRFRENEIRPRAVAVAFHTMACRTIARVKRSSRIEIATRRDRRRCHLRRRVCWRCCVCIFDAGLHETLANIINHGERLLFRQSCTPSGHRRAGASVENGFQHASPGQQGSRLGARKIQRRRNQPLTCPRTSVASVTVTHRAILMIELSGFWLLCPCSAGAQPSERKGGQTDTKAESEGVHWPGVVRFVDRVEDLVR